MAPIKTENPKSITPEDLKAMQEKYVEMETLRSRLLTDRAPYLDTWYDIQAHLDPHLVIWDPSTTGFPDFNDVFTDSSPFQAFDDMVAGLQSGITPATQEWFQVAPWDDQLEEDEEVLDWCHKVTELYKWTFLKSNFYQQTPAYYRSATRFLTAAMMCEEDFKTRCRYTVFPIGSFYCSNNDQGLADTFVYESRWKLRQLVEKFCVDAEGNEDLSNLDAILTAKWKDQKQHEDPINIVYCIRPNPMHDPKKAMYDAKYKKYSADYYVRDSAEKKILQQKGFDNFPVFVFRWFRQFTDAYGVDGPGRKAMGDVKQLYKSVQMYLTGLEKVIEPPMLAPQEMAGYPMGTVPGYLTIGPGATGTNGVKPAYQISPDFGKMMEFIDRLVKKIEKTCMADIFRQLANDDRKTPTTATEIMQKMQENYNVLGPVYGNFDFEWLQPLFEYMFEVFLRQGAVPPPPQQLAGRPLKVKIISRVAMALKLVETTGYDKFLDYILKASEANPDVKDNLKWDELIKRYAISSNLPTQILNGEDVVQQMRTARQQAIQQQQAAERVPALAGAAKDLSQASPDGGNVLGKIMGNKGNGAAA